MTPTGRDLSRAALELRLTFDTSFAQAHAPEPPPQLDWLEIRVAGHGYVLRLSEVLAVHAERKLVPVPAPRPDLLGLIGVRGVVSPVYDLSALLGYAGVAAPRFIVQVRADAPFAVAFEQLERHLRVPERDFTLSAGDDAGTQRFTPGSVKSASGLIPAIDLLAIFREVTSSTQRPGAHAREERT